MTVTHVPQYIRAEVVKCRVVIVTAPVAKRDQANCALSNHERHHGCQNAPISYIPHKIPMYENVVLSDVASSLSQRPSRIATKQLRALERRAAPRLPKKRSHTDIYSLAHAIGMLPQAYHHCHSTRRGTQPSNYAISNDERPAAAFKFPMALVHPPIYMSGKLSNVASSLSQRPSRIATRQLRALEQRAAPDCQNAPPR